MCCVFWVLGERERESKKRPPDMSSIAFRALAVADAVLTAGVTTPRYILSTASVSHKAAELAACPPGGSSLPHALHADLPDEKRSANSKYIIVPTVLAHPPARET